MVSYYMATLIIHYNIRSEKRDQRAVFVGKLLFFLLLLINEYQTFRILIV